MYTHIHKYNPPKCIHAFIIYAYEYIYIYIYIHTYLYLYMKCMYILMHITRFLKNCFTLKYGGLPPIACPLENL